MKKKHGKYIALGIIGIIAILIAVNWRNIKLLMNIISSEPEDTIKITETELDELKNPLLDIVEEEEKVGKKVKEKVEAQNENQNKNTYKNENETNNEKDIPPEKDDNKTIEKNNDELYAKILTKYNTKFEALQSNFEGQLDDMVKEGYKEYKNGNVSKIKLANKYISMSQALEKESDNSFNQVLKEMEKELKNNGFDTSIAKDVNSYYKNYKDKKKIAILSKGSKIK